MNEGMQITTCNFPLSYLFITTSRIYLLAILVNIDLRVLALIVSLIKIVTRIKCIGVVEYDSSYTCEILKLAGFH